MNPSVSVFTNILQNAIRLLSGAGVSDKTIQQITGVVQFAGTLVREGQKGYEELKVVDEEIRRLVDENRPPTEEEWATWEGRLRSVDERFARLKERLG